MKLNKRLKKHWKNHKKATITWAQIIVILTLITGTINNWIASRQNSAKIQHSEKWIGDNLGDKSAWLSNIQADVNNLKTNKNKR